MNAETRAMCREVREAMIEELQALPGKKHLTVGLAETGLHICATVTLHEPYYGHMRFAILVDVHYRALPYVRQDVHGYMRNVLRNMQNKPVDTSDSKAYTGGAPTSMTYSEATSDVKRFRHRSLSSGGRQDTVTECDRESG